MPTAFSPRCAKSTRTCHSIWASKRRTPCFRCLLSLHHLSHLPLAHTSLQHPHLFKCMCFFHQCSYACIRVIGHCIGLGSAGAGWECSARISACVCRAQDSREPACAAAAAHAKPGAERLCFGTAHHVTACFFSFPTFKPFSSPFSSTSRRVCRGPLPGG